MIEKEKLMASYDELCSMSNDAQEVYNGLVDTITADLDSVMQKIYESVVMKDDVPIDTIQTLFVQLGNYVYFFGSSVERVGLDSDLAENLMKEKYNAAYNDNLVSSDGKKRTANELTAIAEKYSLSETVLSDIYKRVYKTVKFKVDSAQSMVNSLSKILTKKMQEFSFSKDFDQNSSRILME